MSNINAQIDAAVPTMRARAAEFDDKMQPIDEWVREQGTEFCIEDLLNRAAKNIGDAIDDHLYSGVWEPDSILDAMNLCALALSLPPGPCDVCDQHTTHGECFADNCSAYPDTPEEL